MDPARREDAIRRPAERPHSDANHKSGTPAQAQSLAQDPRAQAQAAIKFLKTAILQNPEALSLVTETCNALSVSAPGSKRDKNETALKDICNGKLQEILGTTDFRPRPDTSSWVAACKEAYVHREPKPLATVNLPTMLQPGAVTRPRNAITSIPRADRHPNLGASTTSRQGSAHGMDRVPVAESHDDPRPRALRSRAPKATHEPDADPGTDSAAGRRPRTRAQTNFATARMAKEVHRSDVPNDTTSEAITTKSKRAAPSKKTTAKTNRVRASESGRATIMGIKKKKKKEKYPHDPFYHWEDWEKALLIEIMKEVARGQIPGGWKVVADRLKEREVRAWLIDPGGRNPDINVYRKLRECAAELVRKPEVGIDKALVAVITRLTKGAANSARAKQPPRKASDRPTVTRWSTGQTESFIKEMGDMAAGRTTGGWEAIQKNLEENHGIPGEFLYNRGGAKFFLMVQFAKALVERGLLDQSLLDSVVKIDKEYRAKLRKTSELAARREKRGLGHRDPPSDRQSSVEDMSDQFEPASPTPQPDLHGSESSQSRSRGREGTRAQQERH